MANDERYFGCCDYNAVVEFAKRIEKDLLATDPGFRCDVLIVHEEGTTLFYRSAFLEELDEWIIVFTEHHGTHVYHESDLLLYRQFLPEKIVDPESEWDVAGIQKLFFNLYAEYRPIEIATVRHRVRNEKP